MNGQLRRSSNRLYYTFIVVFGAIVFMMVFGACGSYKSLACEDTPGFCPNPPSEGSHYDQPPRQYHTPNSGTRYE